MPFTAALLAALAALSMRTATSSLCPPNSRDYEKTAAGNKQRCNWWIAILQGNNLRDGENPQCSINCICDPATGEWSWQWEENNAACPPLGRLVNTMDLRGLKHPKCGTLAVRTRSGAECVINCHTDEFKRYNFNNYNGGNKMECDTLRIIGG